VKGFGVWILGFGFRVSGFGFRALIAGSVAAVGFGVQGSGIRGRNVKRFRGGLVSKAHRRLYHSTLGLRVIKK